jgi:hypothetical protein
MRIDSIKIKTPDKAKLLREQGNNKDMEWF